MDNSAEAEPADKPKAAKAKSKVAKPVIDEPLMAELEKAPPLEEPVMPTAREAAAARARAGRRFEEPPPRNLRLSFYFFLASGLVWLITSVIFLITKQRFIDAAIEQSLEQTEGPRSTPDEIASIYTNAMWLMVIISLTFAVFLGLFGYKATEGVRRARVLVTIFSGVLILFHLFFGGLFGLFSILLALIGLGLLWSRTARAYFPPRQRP